MDDLNLEEAVDGFGQCGVIAVANTADGGFDACFGQPLGVFDRQILAAAITVVNQPHETPARLPLSTWALLTPSFRACGAQPIFEEIERTACQRDPCWP